MQREPPVGVFFPIPARNEGLQRIKGNVQLMDDVDMAVVVVAEQLRRWW
jgi:hypothetical protein